MKKLALFILFGTLALTICACGSTASPAQEPGSGLEGTWYGVYRTSGMKIYNIEAGQMYLFKDGEILKGGATVGTYEVEGESSVVVSIEGNSASHEATPHRMYLNQSDNGVDVLTNTEAGDNVICFCRGADNWRDLAEQQDERGVTVEHSQKKLDDFAVYVLWFLPGKWVAAESSTGLQAFTVDEDFSVMTVENNAGQTYQGKIIKATKVWSEAYPDYPAVQLELEFEGGETVLYDILRPRKTDPHYNDGFIVCGGEHRTEGGALFIKSE